MAINQEALLDRITTEGWYVQSRAFDGNEIAEWVSDIRALQQLGVFQSAAIGRQQTHQVNDRIRGDSTYWFDSDNLSIQQTRYVGYMETLRQYIQQNAFLGVMESEFHYASYPVGSCYQRHIDQHHTTQARLLTVITYLNTDWCEEDGGLLRLFVDAEKTIDILPTAGTFVCFLSERFWHEVLPAKKERLSISGWLRRQSVINGALGL